MNHRWCIGLALPVFGLLAACETVPVQTTAWSAPPIALVRPEEGRPQPEEDPTMPADGISPPEVAAASRPSDAGIWLRIRQGMGMEPLRGDALTRMQAHDAWYRQRPEHLRRVFERARPYLFDIVNEVQASGLPMEVALLPAVESAFLPTAVSSAQADGLWQFMAPTAQRFELRRNLFVDERRSPAAATRAALRYLSVLRDRYSGDMQLALAAYNCGEGCIDAHLRRAEARGLPGRLEHLTLNAETAHYVPRLVALSRLVAEAVDTLDLARIGLPAMPDAPMVARVALTRDIDKALAARLAGISVTELEALNPQHSKPLLVAAAGQGLVLPLNRVEEFGLALSAHKGPLASWTTHLVARNTSVEALARQLGADASALRSVNRIAPGHLIIAGSTVLVPKGERSEEVAEAKVHQAFLRTAPAFSLLRVKLARGWGWQELTREVNRKGIAVTVQELRSANTHLSLRAGWVRLRVPAADARVPPARGATRTTRANNQGASNG